MDDEGRPTNFWSRLIFPLFQPRQLTVVEWRLGLAVIGIALLFTWLIFWTFIPRLIGDVLLAVFNGISWVAGLFAGSGTTDTAAPVLTQVPSALPSPSPSPSPSPFSSPFPR